MSQFLEIEFKNLLDVTEYNILFTHFNFDVQLSKKQTNIYFDTKENDLKKHDCALRVRIINNNIELTLKQKIKVGILETTDIINENELNMLINENKLVQKEVANKLKQLGFTKSLHHLASFITYRYEVNYENNLLVLDKSIFYGKIDYELELETKEYNNGLQVFNKILTEFSIKKKSSKNKISRALEYKNMI